MAKRKLWSQESMEAALRNIHDGDGLRVKGIVYNIPVETLQRRATGTVTIVCRPA